jgi:PAS domain S-box-containing protein
MECSIKILILENDPNDLELMQYELKRSGLQYVARTVQTRESYEKALCHFQPDIILSDFSLPSFDGMAAFKCRQQLSPETPFIIVSGTIGDEKSAELIKMGVTDYVLKENMYQVAPKVLRAFKEAGEQKERVLAQEKLKLREEQLKKILNQSLDVICTMDEQGHFVLVGAASRNVWGYEADELVGKKYTELVYQADVENTREVSQAIMNGLEVTNFENRYVRRDGEIVTMSWSARWDTTDNLMYCVARDATDIKKAARQLEEQNERILNIFESMTTGFLSIDRNWTVQYWNREAELMLGLDRNQVVNKYFWDVFPDAISTAFYPEYHRVMEQGEVTSFEEYLPGVGIWFDVKAYPGKDGVSVFFQDITERKEAEASRQQMTEDLYRQNNDLQQFTYIVSHNLRAPVANALGLTKLLTTLEKDDETFDISLAHLKTSVFHLDTVLKDINTILSIRDRQDVLEKEPVKVAEVLREAFYHLQEPLHRCGGKVHITIDEELSVSANRAYLYSIFYNLLSNAIKYRSDERELQIQIACCQRADGGKTISFSDNGSGFDMKKAGSNVFKLYKRFHTRKEGRGIGLHLVKTHLESMGGQIEVSSQVNVGTIFLIYLK